MQKYTTTLRKEEATHFVGSSNVLRFISTNLGISWNAAINFVYDNGICSYDQNISFWNKAEMNSKSAEKNYNSEAVKWVRAWFEAHPWMNNVAFVYDK